MCRWSTIARYLPGRTNNEIKNYWRTHFKKKQKASAKQDSKKKIQRQRNQQQQNCTIANKLSPKAEEVIMQKSDEKIDNEYQDAVTFTNYHQSMDPIVDLAPVMTSSDISYAWTDTIPMDGLWGGLWNLDVDDKCKVAIQNEPTTANYSYSTDYAVNLYNGGFIF